MAGFSYMLAPIEDMTSNAFRTICFRHGADLTFTEMVRFNSLARNNKTTWERIKLNDSTPTAIQLIGHREIFLKKFLSKFSPAEGFAGFDLNLGCPAPNFVNNGMGCAMIKRIAKTKALVGIIKKAGYTISIKLRLGLNQFEKDKKVYLNLINAADADFFVVHARHGMQTYAEPADFSVYEDCVKTGKEIIANGDINTKEQVDSLKKIGVKGVMIGRAAVAEPTIFNRLKGIQTLSLNKVLSDYLILVERFGEPFRYRKNIQKHIGQNPLFNAPNL